MKKVFNFQDRVLELDIAGKSFSLVCDEKLAVKLQKMQSKFGEFMDVEKLQKMPLEKITRACRDITDDILGKNAFSAIFENRVPGVQDGIDVTVFLLTSITEKFREQKPVVMAPVDLGIINAAPNGLKN